VAVHGHWFEVPGACLGDLMGQDVHGATLGIVGMGRIGQAVARRARGFDMRILYSDPSEPEAARELGATRVALDDQIGRAHV